MKPLFAKGMQNGSPEKCIKKSYIMISHIMV